MTEDGTFPVTMWHSALGEGDGIDYSTRSWLRALLTVGYEHVLVVPSGRLRLHDDPELSEFAPLLEYPEKYRFRKKLVEAGDPRVGGQWTDMPAVTWADSGNGNMVKWDNVVRVGDVDRDYYRDRPQTSPWSPRTELVVIHRDPNKLVRTRDTLARMSGGSVPVVGMTAWEYDRVSEGTAQQLSDLDMLVVQSEHTRRAFERSGLDPDVLVRVVPPALTTAPLSADELAVLRPRESGRFVFYAIGTLIARKNLEAVIAAYCRAFGPTGFEGVGLIVKTQASFDKLEGLMDRALALAGTRTQPPVALYGDRWPLEKIRLLHTQGDCYVEATHGEGFGLAAVEAALMGNPVITPEWGAQAEAVSGLVDDYNTLISGKLVPVDPEQARLGVYTPDQQWFNPDVDALANAMRQAVERWLPKSLERARLAADRYSNARVGQLMAAALNEAKV